MSVLLRSGPVAPSVLMRGLVLAAAGATIALAGCSASITRFDNPSFALGEGAGGTVARRTPGGPVLDTPPRLSDASPAPASRPNGTQVAGLPVIEPQQSGAQVPPVRAMAVTKGTPTAASAPPAVPPPSQVPARGQQIEVHQGDTLYGLSRKHNVLIVDLMAVNELRSPNLKPGQKLYLPATTGVRATPQVRPERVAAARPAPSAAAVIATAAPEVPSSASVDDSGETYTVKPGDSLYAIAARHKIKLLDLQRANEIADARKVKPGMVLKIPGQGRAIAQPAAPIAGETMQPEARIVRVGGPTSAAPPGVRLLNDGQPPSAASSVPAAASPAEMPPAIASSGKLRWPVRGRVIQSFGARPDGSHNDGIDIAVPAGTDVLAAEGGVVAYAGNEVKTYGNLVLIRHDNGWVTAYAYNEKILVQRGDRVKRGQSIAKAGKTGAADQPQVHFEVRVGSKPVDPVGYLEKL